MGGGGDLGPSGPEALLQEGGGVEAHAGVHVGKQVHEHALPPGLLQGGVVQAAARDQQQQDGRPHVPGPQGSLHPLEKPDTNMSTLGLLS